MDPIEHAEFMSQLPIPPRTGPGPSRPPPPPAGTEVQGLNNLPCRALRGALGWKPTQETKPHIKV
jgi:hypothetical protein